jgi:hypothetical protein
VLAVAQGFKVGEVDVPHRARLHGESKFGRARFWRGFFDLITVKFLTTYKTRPFHILGGMGLACGAFGSGLLAWMLVEWLSHNPVGTRPALLAGVLLVLVGVQLASLGLMAELIVYRTRRREQVRATISASGGLAAGIDLTRTPPRETAGPTAPDGPDQRGGTLAIVSSRLCVPYASGRCVKVGARSFVSRARRVDVNVAFGSRLCTYVDDDDTTKNRRPTVFHPSASRWRSSGCASPRMTPTSAPHQPRNACGARSSVESVRADSTMTTAARGPMIAHASVTTAR